MGRIVAQTLLFVNRKKGLFFIFPAIISTMRKKIKGLLTLGQEVRRLRKALHLTQKELAETIDVDRSYIGHIERGRTKMPSKEVITALARGLYSTPEHLAAAAGLIEPTRPKLPPLRVYLQAKYDLDEPITEQLARTVETLVFGYRAQRESEREQAEPVA